MSSHTSIRAAVPVEGEQRYAIVGTSTGHSRKLADDNQYTVISIAPYGPGLNTDVPLVNPPLSGRKYASRCSSTKIGGQQYGLFHGQHTEPQRVEIHANQRAVEAYLNEHTYYGGESLWNQDFAEDISMVSYRAGHMTNSVKHLFSAIKPNACPLRRGETRDDLYRMNETYRKSSLLEYSELPKSRFMSRSVASQNTQRSNASVTLSTAKDEIAGTNSNTDLAATAKTRSSSKSAVLRDKLEMFPSSRAASRMQPANTTSANPTETDATNVLTKGQELRIPRKRAKSDGKLFSVDRAAITKMPSFPATDFRKAFTYARFHLSKWLQHKVD